jgi:hypothetical protein
LLESFLVHVRKLLQPLVDSVKFFHQLAN